MTSAEIVREISRLRLQEQLEVHRALKDLLNQHQLSTKDLTAAARALLSDYKNDPELTAFTALDAEDFHAAR
jgi:hypothetical protein